ncbi:BppU family phage baseplate upper protein [Enterococcus faecium]|uniref:BppU family phage baseplate upper protein n=1 Tax=Enterococcus faecium TaxID=1352 RepID=UPI001D133FCD|nr:BppU family phage baseplate upper protein [Enterococcus faecium]UEC07623.1 BppU family phage baseplate upper protein [Enterococcus faecium]UEC10686.1 BppU family phage baseplate upper protein [Enterococcus faecium]
MASSLYNLALDFSKELNYTKAIMARQGDKGITVTVKPYLNGLQMDTSGGTFTLKGTTPSNRYVDSVATSVTSEEVTFSLDGTFMSEAGYYKHCYVEYRKDNQILTTQDIIFFSLGVSDISQGQADEYVSQLEELIRKYNETFDAFMAEIKGRVDSLNQQITDLTGQAKTLQDKLDALKEEISKLGNLQVMYSNSIDFGDYDYSGNPNLLPNLKASDFNTPKGMTAEQVGSAIKFTFDGTPSLSASTVHITALAPNTYYTLSADVTILDSTGADTDQLRLYIRKETNSSLINLVFPAGMKLNEKTKVQLTGNSSANTDPSQFVYMYMTLHTTTDKPFKGSVLVENIKLEKAISAESKATPYQPNLLDAPYYFSKVALGENIADPTVKFPITSSSEGIYSKNAPEDFVLGETYTVTIGATKPASQTIRVYLAQKQFSDFKPVEGLVDTWVATVSITQLGENAKGVYLFQTPNTSLGSCTIKWLKIEKGDTRTPNIEQYKYRGIGMRDSNNPKDYVWDLAPEYVEDNLATDVKISEITGKANNYTDGKVSEINSQLTASINEVDKKVTANTKSITTINSTLTEMQKPVKYEAWFSGGTELRPANSNSRFRVSEERLTIGTKLNVAMNESPLEWNADRWEATFTRECSILVDVQTMVEFADQWGTYVYINMWKDTNQTQTWDTGYGMGIASGANFWFRTELSVSMYCMNAKVGDKFSIGLGMASGKSLTSARIHKLHIMEL